MIILILLLSSFLIASIPKHQVPSDEKYDQFISPINENFDDVYQWIHYLYNRNQQAVEHIEDVEDTVQRKTNRFHARDVLVDRGAYYGSNWGQFVMNALLYLELNKLGRTSNDTVLQRTVTADLLFSGADISGLGNIYADNLNLTNAINFSSGIASGEFYAGTLIVGGKSNFFDDIDLNASDISSVGNIYATNLDLSNSLNVSSITIEGTAVVLKATSVYSHNSDKLDGFQYEHYVTTKTVQDIAGQKEFLDVILGTITSCQLDRLGSATYETVQDNENVSQSVGKISGSSITNNGDGTLAVTAGTGKLRAVDIDTSTLFFCDWPANDALGLVDDSLNFITVKYNGGSPIISTQTDITSISFTDEFVIGYVYRRGTTLGFLEIGNRIPNHDIDHCLRLFYRGIEHMSGGALGRTGDRYLTTTAGVYYLGDCPINTGTRDTSGTDEIEGYYRRDGAGGWTIATGVSQIDNLNYDDGSGSTTALTANRYGLHWEYRSLEGDINIVYGQGNYKLADALLAQQPTTIPDYLSKYAIASTKIIIQKSATYFYSIQDITQSLIPPSKVNNHNELSNIQGGTTDEYYHFTNSEHTELNGWLDDVTLGSSGALSLTGNLDIGWNNIIKTSSISCQGIEISTSFVTVTDYTDEGINAALNFAGAGGTVFMPAATYTIDGVITIPASDMTLMGMGRGTYLDASSWSTDHVINLNGQDELYLKDFKIIGNRGGGNAKDLIYDGNSGVTNSIFDSLYLGDSDNNGFFFDSTGSDNNTIINCEVYRSDNAGIRCDGQYLRLVNNYWNDNTNQGIYLVSGDVSYIANNLCFSNGYTGMHIATTDNCTITGNLCQSNTREGILIEGGTYNTITGNNCYGNTFEGIEIRGYYVSVVGNICRLNGQSGTGYSNILLNTCDYSNVTGNNTFSAGNLAGYGIRLINSDFNVVNGNVGLAHPIAGIYEDTNCNNNEIYGNNFEGVNGDEYRLNGVGSSYMTMYYGNIAFGSTGSTTTATYGVDVDTSMRVTGKSYFDDDADFNDNAILDIDWSTSDDGAGSDLDADKLDGNDSLYFVPQSSMTYFVSQSSAGIYLVSQSSATLYLITKSSVAAYYVSQSSANAYLAKLFTTNTITSTFALDSDMLNDQVASYYLDYTNFTVDDNEISGDKIDGGTISNLSVTGSADFDDGIVMQDDKYIGFSLTEGIIFDDSENDIYILPGQVAIGTTNAIGESLTLLGNSNTLIPRPPLIDSSNTIFYLQNNANINSDCEQLFVSGIGGRCGILFADSGDTDIGGLQYYHADNRLSFRTNNSTGIAIDSSQNLEVWGNIELQTTNTYIGRDGDERIIFDASGDDIEIMGADVGINEHNPSYNLDVNGTFRATGAGTFGEDVGIGTTTPKVIAGWTGNTANTLNVVDPGDQARLAVQGGTNANIDMVDMGATEDQGWFNMVNDNQTVTMRIIAEGATSVPVDNILVIDNSNGNIGLNDKTPSYKLDVDGTGRFTGAVTTGGSDPPYVQYWAEIRDSIIEYVKGNIPPQYLNGATIFYNKDTDQMEMFMANRGQFRSLHTNEILETVDPITETFKVENEYKLDEDTGKVMRWQNPVNKAKYVIEEEYKFDTHTGEFKNKLTGSVVSKDEAVKLDKKQ